MRGSYTVGNLPYNIDYNGERNVIAGNTMQMKKNHVNNSKLTSVTLKPSLKAHSPVRRNRNP